VVVGDGEKGELKLIALTNANKKGERNEETKKTDWLEKTLPIRGKKSFCGKGVEGQT